MTQSAVPMSQGPSSRRSPRPCVRSCLTAATAVAALGWMAVMPAPASAVVFSEAEWEQLPLQASGAVFELGLSVGVWFPSLSSGLGDSHYRYDVPGPSPVLSVRAAWQAATRWAVEADVRIGDGDLRTRDDFIDFGGESDLAAWTEGGSYRLHGLRLGVRRDLVDRGPALPFLRMYAGFDATSSGKAFVKRDDQDWLFGVGAGLRLKVHHRLRLRLDLEGWAGEPAVSRPNAPGGGASASPTLNGSILFGVAVLVGLPPPDRDGDGLADDADRCPDDAEDKDGYLDVDGCPDPDNDGDGFADAKDRCPDEAEDEDQHEDQDGCPDPDNDGDGVPDASDRCPQEAEDKDGVEDSDGCPDLDRDGDGIEDARDRCPLQPEDRDGHQDDDGCPDPDDDGDGVLDRADRCPSVAGVAAHRGCPDPDADSDGFSGDADRCPSEAETWNGVSDDDGCPDGAPLLTWQGRHLHLLKPPVFKGATLRRDSAPTLDAIAAALRLAPWPRVAIEVHGDDRDAGKAGLARSEARARTLTQALIDRGVAAERLTPRGYGDARPLCLDAASLRSSRDRGGLAACRETNARIGISAIKDEATR